jgi:hypothetical protein
MGEYEETILVIPDNVTRPSARFSHGQPPDAEGSRFGEPAKRFRLQWTSRSEKRVGHTPVSSEDENVFSAQSSR